MMKVIIAALLIVSISAVPEGSIPENYSELVRIDFNDTPVVNSRSKRDLDYENSVCECVPYYQCNYEGTMNVDGEGIIDIRTGPAGTVDAPTAKRRPCDHYLSVCCLPPEKNSATGGQVLPSNPGTGEQGNPAQNPGAGGGLNGKNHINKGCGYRNPTGVSFRITGNFDNEANFAEFPWMVAVLTHEKKQGNLVKFYKCGGSLIHKRVVLTAAHCVFGASASEISIRAGEWDTQTRDEPLPHQDRDVATIITHPEFKAKTLWNDYALLILNTPVDLADNVEVVCLPEPTANFDNSKCFSTGWGKKDFGEKGHYQVILKSVELPTVPRDKCQNDLRNTRLGKYFELNSSFMCAGGISGFDACSGDGGSPLVCPLQYDSTRYVQAGIVAWGIGCGQQDIPGVYADVAKGRSWIDQALASYSIDSTSYSPGGNSNYPSRT